MNEFDLNENFAKKFVMQVIGQLYGGVKFYCENALLSLCANYFAHMCELCATYCADIGYLYNIGIGYFYRLYLYFKYYYKFKAVEIDKNNREIINYLLLKFIF